MKTTVKKAKKKLRFPKTLYMVVDDEGGEDECLMPSKNFREFATLHEKTPIAVYQLVKEAKLVNASEIL